MQSSNAPSVAEEKLALKCAYRQNIVRATLGRKFFIVWNAFGAALVFLSI